MTDIRPQWMKALQRLIGNTPSIPRGDSSHPMFGTVKQLNPLRITLDNDPVTWLNYAPPVVNTYPTAIGQRVWADTYGRQVVIVGCVVAPPPAVPTYAQEVLADGPTVFYLLDEAASPGVDLAGTTTQSTITGVSWAQAGIGTGATSAAFASGSLRTSTAAALGGNGAITLEALVHATDWSGDRLVVAVSEAGGEVIFLRPQNGVLRMTIETSAGNYTTVTGSTVMTTGRSYHVAGTWDGSAARLYIDGVLDTTQSLGSRYTPASAPFVQLGRRTAGSDSYFAGRMAGVAVHMGALSGARILAHAQAAGL